MTVDIVTSKSQTSLPKTLETLPSSPSTKAVGIEALPSSLIRNQFLSALPRLGLRILTDPRFMQMNLSDQKIVLNNLKGITSKQLPQGLDPTLVDYVDSLNLPREEPAENLQGKHLASFYQRQTANLNQNQRRLYAQEVVKSSSFRMRPQQAQQIIRDSLGLPNDSNVTPSKKTYAPPIKKNWMQELQESPYVLTAAPSQILKGTKNQLITLRDAEAIVAVFKDQDLTICEYAINSEALTYIQDQAPQIKFLRLPIENRAATSSRLLSHELEQKWARAATSGVYLPNHQNLPLIDQEDAEAIVNAKIPCAIRGYAITADALQVFERHSFTIDPQANLIVGNTQLSTTSSNWAQLIEDNTTVSAKTTEFDQSHQIATLKEAMEPSPTWLLIALSSELIDLRSAESLISALGAKIKLMGYKLTQEAANYLQEQGIDITKSTVSHSKDPSVAAKKHLVESWQQEMTQAHLNSSWFWQSASGWQLQGDEQRLITRTDAEALVQVLPPEIANSSLTLIDYWLTKEAADFLKNTVVKFPPEQVAKDEDPSLKTIQRLSDNWKQQAIPLSQFRQGITGSFPLIDTEEVQKLITTCQTLDISDQLQVTGYAMTDEAYMLLKKNFPHMELFLGRNILVTSSVPPLEWMYPGFDDLLVSESTLDGNLAQEISQNQAPVIDKENIEDLIVALQQLYPHQKVALLGYTVSADVQNRLAIYADLRFCKMIEAPILSKSELPVAKTAAQEIAPVMTPQERERKWTLTLQKNTDTVQGNYFARPFSPQDKMIDLDDAKTIVQTCRNTTGSVDAIRGHTITQEAFDYLKTHAPEIDLRLNRIAPSQETLVHCEKIGKALAMLLSCVIIVVALAGTFMLIGEVAFIILAFATIGYFLAVIGKAALGVTKPVRWVAQILPLWLYMLELYARSFSSPSERREEKIGRAIENTLQKFLTFWRTSTPSQALIIKG